MLAKWAVVILVTGALLGAVVGAAASLSVGGVDELGSGSATVAAPTGVTVTDVEWTLLPTDTSKVGKVDVTFAANPGGDCLPAAVCTAHLTVKDEAGTVLGTFEVSPFVISASFPTTVTWTLNGLAFSAAATATFAITVTGPG